MKWMAAFFSVGLSVAGWSAAEEWLAITGPPELSFPRDHGAHPDYQTEWWYVTGLVDTEAGDRYGFQVTFFRQGLDPGDPKDGSSKLRARQIIAAHLAIADISGQRFDNAERVRRTGGGLAGFSEVNLEVWLDDWEMKTVETDSISIRAQDKVAGIGLDIELRPERALVLHGHRGYSQKGHERSNASAYLSWTRLAVTGALEVGGSRRQVEGAAWFDHEWGTSQLGEGVVGWDWFSLRLDDGRDLMVYRLRRTDGTADPHSSGTIIDADGSVALLARDDVELEVLGSWQSPATGARYPARWRLRVPTEDIDLEVQPLIADAEVDGSASTGVVYWEGPVSASGSAAGEGFVELTGYAGTLADRF